MRDPRPLNVGDSVDFGEFVGIEGTTGHSTGIHLHIGSQDMTGKDSWTFRTSNITVIRPYSIYGISKCFKYVCNLLRNTETASTCNF